MKKLETSCAKSFEPIVKRELEIINSIPISAIKLTQLHESLIQLLQRSLRRDEFQKMLSVFKKEVDNEVNTRP